MSYCRGKMWNLHRYHPVQKVAWQDVKGSQVLVGNYDEAVKMMGDTAFLSSLINFPKEAITDETVELLKPYFKAPDFNFESAKKVRLFTLFKREGVVNSVSVPCWKNSQIYGPIQMNPSCTDCHDLKPAMLSNQFIWPSLTKTLARQGKVPRLDGCMAALGVR